MNCQQANKIDIVNYLKKQGNKAEKTQGNSIWFLSPFRGEKTASFKVDIVKNLWYDFAEGIGGTFIDLILKLNNCTIKEALEKLANDSFSFHQQPKIIQKEKTYSILKSTPLKHPNLISYLEKRKINIEFAKQFCCQVHFSFAKKKEEYAIAFKNNLDGFEIRNKYRKIGLGKKSITTISNNSYVVSIFESWSDFLSYLTLKKDIPAEDFIILNSTAMIKKAIELIANYSEIKVFFDNDKAGDKALECLIQNTKIKIIDHRIYYKNYKDLNEYLINRN